MATPTREPDTVRAELIEAAIRLLADQGTEALVLRRVASAAHVSTMCVYSRFGDKVGLLNAVYAAGFENLNLAMSKVQHSHWQKVKKREYQPKEPVEFPPRRAAR